MAFEIRATEAMKMAINVIITLAHAEMASVIVSREYVSQNVSLPC